MAAVNRPVLTAESSGAQQTGAWVRLYAASHAEKFGLTHAEFVHILREIAGRYLGRGIGEAEELRFCRDLQLEELALAQACAKGTEAAWERFIAQYRPKLRSAALAITREETMARELADSLYAELFGTRLSAEGGRISKLRSYTGRGSLEGWLRTVLAQEYVNRVRRQRRLVSFDERIGEERGSDSTDCVDPRVEASAGDALTALSAEERFLVASYYLDGRRLAEIAATLGMHESTVSRRLGKITGGLRKRIVSSLCARGMSMREAKQAIAGGVCNMTIDIPRLLGWNSGARNRTPNRSEEEAG